MRPANCGENLAEHALAAVAVDDALVVDEIRRRRRQRALRYALATARCFRSARKRSNDMPLWQAAPPRGAAAVTAGAGRGAVARGAPGAAGRGAARGGCGC